ncbi:MAG: hypothetical protein M3Q63_01270 [bacterium]|nr:hypothetical protein [bacterium]
MATKDLDREKRQRKVGWVIIISITALVITIVVGVLKNASPDKVPQETLELQNLRKKVEELEKAKAPPMVMDVVTPESTGTSSGTAATQAQTTSTSMETFKDVDLPERIDLEETVVIPADQEKLVSVYIPDNLRLVNGKRISRQQVEKVYEYRIMRVDRSKVITCYRNGVKNAASTFRLGAGDSEYQPNKEKIHSLLMKSENGQEAHVIMYWVTPKGALEENLFYGKK